MNEEDPRAKPEAFLATMQASMTIAGVDGETIERHPDSTIVPSAPGSSTPDPTALLALLATGQTLDARVELRGTLGEGGMGVVRLGRQRSLDRAVAVKSLRPESRDAQSTERLLREAWVTGYLDHPNVVPVYDIVADSDGSPLIMLKKIEGVAWSDLVHDAAEVERRFGTDDLLGWNVGVALAVCNAISFAHSRGVLHRDIKPENVMIGAFGEVYVVDWGLAVMTRDDGSGRLPAASDAKALAGTPHYMAPEMLGMGGVPDERTDVYLLGSVLHELATGDPPHCGKGIFDILASVALSQPHVPEDVQPDLAAIIVRAMQRDPASRYASVDELRRALQASLRARDADQIARRGVAMLENLLAFLDTRGASAKHPTRERHDEAEIQRRFVECRATLRGALDVWPEHAVSLDAMSRLVVAVIESHLDRGDPRAASALLQELDDPPPTLVARVEKARASKIEETERLRELERDFDPRHGGRTRFVVVMIIGCIWVVAPIAVNTLVLTGVLPMAGGPENIVVPLVLLAIVLGIGVWARESMMRTKVNRLVALSAVLAMFFSVVSTFVAIVGGETPFSNIHDQLLVFAGIIAMGAAAIDMWLFAVAATYLIGYVVVPFVGVERALYVLAASNTSVLAFALLRWRGHAATPRAKDDDDSLREG